ncbi:DUF6923 family protein [Microbacterium sp. SSM24]|uniref:DUF6923 family protein n=1 Tax=Microbacterium sp. SSM24 TaxID=2991714 RepID=UPI0022270162|nr:SpaA isopeptide-forming pilin-related protein [Microbacterium sp. SSM24]MCW3494666.1 SpaA isopeptide-forming pilin-related protein [Microbacterium sp. SSM24]
MLTIAAIAAALVLAPFGTSSPAAAAPGDAFDPTAARVFVTQDVPSRLYTAVQGNGSITLQPDGAAAAIGYNAVGFNSADNYLYGIRRDTGFRTVLVRIGQGGVVTSLGSVTGLPAPPGSDIYNQGTFGSDATADTLYVRGSQSPSGQMWAVNVTTRVATLVTLSASVPNLSDLVWKDGYLWGLNTNDVMYRINPTTGQVSSWATGLGFGGTFGAQWVYGNGNLGLAENTSGTVYQVAITNPTGATPTFSRVSATTGPASANNDGASTPGVDVDLGIVKSGPAFYTPGSAIAYTLTVTNHGPGASSGSQVTDALPTGVTSASTPTPGCAIAAGVLRCALAGLAVGATQTITINATVTSATSGALTNAARVVGNERDPNPANDQSTTTAQTRPAACVAVPVWTNTADGLQQYDPTTFQLISSVPVEREYGDIAWSSNGSVLYAVDYDGGTSQAPVLRTIDPATGDALTAVPITGPILTQGTVPGFGTGLWSLNALTAIDENTLLVGSYSSRAIFRLDVRTGVTTLWTQFPSQISAAGDFTVLPDGDILAFGVRPLDGNLSDSRVFRIHTNGTLTQIGTVPAMWGGAQSGGYFYMAAPAGRINRIALATLPTTNVGALSYTTVLSGGPQFWGASAVQDAGECVGLTITKTPTPAVITGPGELITYEFVVKNIADVRVEAIDVTDVQHAPASPLLSGPTCPQTALEPHTSMTCTATYIATVADVDHGRIDDTASASGTTVDGRDVISNEATATVIAEPILTWSLAKTAAVAGVVLEDGAMVDPGDVLTYTVTITSDATVDIDGVTIVDDLTAVLDDAAFVAGSATLTVGAGSPVVVPEPVGGELTAGPFTLPAGATATVTYRITVADDAWSRTLTNTVTGTAGEPGDPIEPEPCTDECTTAQVTPTPVQIQKVGEASTGAVVPMDGSAWAIWDAATGGTALVGSVPSAISGGSAVTGLFRDVSLPAGSYWLEETRALDGFALLSHRVPFTIGADGAVSLGADVSANVTLVQLDGVTTIRVKDVPALDLPEAGGPGRAGLYALGLILLLSGVASGVLILARQRRSADAAREPRA